MTIENSAGRVAVQVMVEGIGRDHLSGVELYLISAVLA